jgi:alkanesulfonate monooxygenase SsuD/methylene tetrahydromethanopterin reductase-like flavin-dependent oxidoreductase (luciferase family)
MDFGYFTLSDNAYANNTRSANDLVTQIVAEAILAEELGLHSAWIGEHHFNSLGVLSSPELVLAYVAARTKRIRLAPAVTVLPLHHPIRVAEQWATLDLLSGGRVDFATGRGFDRNEYVPFNASFDDNMAVFTEGLEVVKRLWESDEPYTHRGKHYAFDNIAITPRPVQRPMPMRVASFSRPSIELAARLGLGLVVAPFATAMTYGGLAEGARIYREACAAHGTRPERLTCSYFLHFADTPDEEKAGLARQVRYFRECGGTVTPGDRTTAPKSYAYFLDMLDKIKTMRPEDLTERSVLLGSASKIIDTLKKAEAAGIDEVILYFNVGLKPPAQVRDEMARFMAEVAPAFEGAHSQRVAT